MYGCLRGLLPTLRQAQAAGRDWYYADNGYMRPGHFVGYYRITRNAAQHDGQGETDGKRFAALGIELAPWRASGSHIVVCPPSVAWAQTIGLDLFAWMRKTELALRSVTDRPLIWRSKQAGEPLAHVLRNAWALVTYSSNAAVDALIAGVPVICTAPCAARSMSGPIEEVEWPWMRDRERFLGVLADNQFSLLEMRDGTAWDCVKAGSRSTACKTATAL